MPSPANQWYGPRGANCGFGPLRYSQPFSSFGSSPLTGRFGASHSMCSGA